MSSLQNRTAEFKSAVQSMRTRKSTLASASPKRSQQQPSGQQSQFSRGAKDIAVELERTSVRLEKLTQLASPRGLYDDNPAEVQNLTHRIKDDIQALNRNIEVLKRQAGADPAVKANRQSEEYSRNVLVSLQSKLATSSKKFKTILEKRTQIMREARERRDMYAFDRAGTFQTTVPSRLEQEPVNPRSPFAQSTQQQLVLQQNDTYITDRANAMQSVEKTIAELGDVFKQLATLVHEQGETVLRIDANVTDAEVNVEAAHSELVKHLQSVSSNRWLMLKIFAVLIAFFLFFVVFLA